MKDIPGYDNFIKIEPIDKGLSSDKKYYIETPDGRFLLRVSDITEYARKETLFNMMKCAAAIGVPMSCPVDFGICNAGKNVYQLLTWCDGENLEKVLPALSETKQYALGIKAGEILRKIHSVPAPDNLEDFCLACVTTKGKVLFQVALISKKRCYPPLL